MKAISAAGTSGQSGYLNVDTPEATAERPLSPARGSRPNVVLILADDLGWGDVETNNPDSAMTTPRIDGIAAAGVNFTDAHSPSSNCTGTRYGLLTGRYAWRTWLTSGVLNGYDRPLIGPDRPTLGTLLRGHGYRTAAVGKWHLGMDFARLPSAHEVTEMNRGIDFDAEILDSPVDHGFDEFFGTSANLTWNVPAYIRDNRFTANPDRGNQPESGLIRAKEVLGRLTEEGVGFIERAAPEDDPFFLYLPLNAPHVPMAPNDHFRDSTGLGLYGDFVAQIDWTVGQVLDALERTGASENTLVIFTSDNGSYMGGLPNHMSNDHTENPRAFYYRYDTHQSNGGWFGLKGTINEGGHRVPLLLQWPRKIEAGSTVDATVSLTDLYATLADIMEEEPESGVATDSLSLLPLLLGESETRGTPVVHYSGAGMFALRDGRWKLVFGNGRGSLSGMANGEPFGTPWRLYDLEQDPREVRNTARANPAVMARMEAALDRIRSTENGTLPANAALSKLSLAGIDIGAFNPDEPSYSATVDRGIETVEVTALPTETDAGVSISTPEGRLLYGKPQRGRVEVGLAESSTTITITVEAPDKSATATYTVTVTRAGEAAIAGIPLVGETLTADTSGIADEDGLSGASFSHQWVSNDGIGDTDIEGATSATYVLTAEDLGKTIRVRVSFTDDAGHEETLTSPATATVRHPEDVVAWEGELTAGQDAGIVPVRSGYSFFGDLGGTLSPDEFVLEGTTYRVWFLVHSSEGLRLGMDRELPADFTLLVADSDYRGSDGMIPPSIDGVDAYWWPSTPPDWLGDDPVRVGLTVHPDVPLGDRQKAPVTGEFSNFPSEHDWIEDVTFRIYFSEGVATTAGTLRDHVLPVTGGTVSGVEAVGDESRIWALSVTPESSEPITVRIEAGLDCALPGAICSADGRRLFNRMELRVEPMEKNPPTGAPIIRGTVEAGQTLTADTSGIADADGLTGATFSYQWVSYDGNADTDIPGAAGSTYTLVPADEGKSFRVRVSFTDDAGFEESLTSALFGSDWPYGLNASASDGAVALTWQLPAGWPYSSTFQILRNRPELGETEPLVLVKYLQTPGNTYTDTDVESGVLYVYRVKGVDPFGYTGEASELVEIRAGESTPVENTPATGAPAVSGAVQVGGTLTADTSDITDEDGLSGAVFAYQWLADDAEIPGATDSTHAVDAGQEGRTIRVRVSFTDGAGNEETLHSAAAEAGVPIGAPAFANSVTSRSIAENSNAGTAVGRPVVATDADGDPITYTLDGPDMAFFSIDVSGQLRVAEETALDYESRETYTVEVVATGSSGESDTITVTVTVADVTDPNIVFILADDVGYELIGANGSTQYQTPRLDEMARGGVRFTNAHSKPCCSPSRLALMTGKSNVRNYMDQGVLQQGQYLVVDPFREAGYATAIAGKWQLQQDSPIAEGVAAGDIFDTYCLWGTDNTGGNRYWNASLECDGQVIELATDEYAPDLFVDFLLEFINSNQDRPFFAYYPMVLSHMPFEAPPQSQCSGPARRQCIFEDMVTYMDRNVGRLHDKLAELGLLDNTIVVFTSDNGTVPTIVSVLGGETIVGEKTTTLDVSTHVPLIVQVPGGTGGQVVNDLIDFTDFLPTLAEAAALTVSDHVELDGVSFWDRLQGRPGQPREWLYTYYFPNPYARSFDTPARHPEVSYARDKRHKLYRTGEMFDVSVDPHELNPLPVDDRESRGSRTNLQAALNSMPDRGQAIDWLRVRGTSGEARPRRRPVLSGTTVNGIELTLKYAGRLDTVFEPTVASYAVKVDGNEWTVSAVSVATKTVVLTLGSPVTPGQTVTVSYTPGKNALRHVNRDGGHRATPFVDVSVPGLSLPAITGTLRAGETLTAYTSDITDADGLTNPGFSYQWVRNDRIRDTNIESATSATYVLTDVDLGKTIKVRVSFTDDAGNEETLHSAATAAVAAAPPSNSPATGAPTISGTAQVGETLTADTTGISDPDGLDNADFDYQWLADDSDISGATDSTYTLIETDEGRTIRVRVSFTDDGGHSESLTSGPTGAVTAGLELRSATVDGLTLTLTYSEVLDTGVTLPVTAFIVNVNGSPRSLDSVSVGGSAVTLTLSQAVEEGDPLTVDYAAPDGPGSIRDTRGREAESFSGREVTNNTPAAGPEEPSEPAAPLTAEFLDTPESHDGSAVFTFELRLSEEPKEDFSYQTLLNHAFTVTGGEISGVGRLEPPGNVRWQIKVTPSSDASVTIVLPVTTDCGADGAVCTDDGRPLPSRLEFTIPGPPQNTAAEGGPAIGGTPTVGQTLSAVTTGISDADGLANAVFNYQWLAGDAEIAGATNAAYTVAETDLGEAISVRVSFTDDAGNKETLTSAATEAVAAARPPLTAEFLDTPESHDGSAVFTFELRLSEEPKEDFSYQTLLNHAFTVTGGEISGVRRLDPPGNIRWEIQVRPNSGRNVGIVLPITTDCAADGAVCTGDGRMLSNRLEITVPGPGG